MQKCFLCIFNLKFIIKTVKNDQHVGITIIEFLYLFRINKFFFFVFFFNGFSGKKFQITEVVGLFFRNHVKFFSVVNQELYYRMSIQQL